MVDYLNEDEQVEALKKWWNENGKSIVIATVLGLCIALVYQYWNRSQLETAEAAATVYESMQLAIKNNSEIDSYAMTLKQQHENTSYAQFAALQLAKRAVESSDLDKAVLELRWASEHRNDDTTHILADLRLARVLFSQGKFDAVTAIIAEQKTDLYHVQFQELLGDVLVKQGKTDQAYEVYEQANALAKKQGFVTPTLNLKLKHLVVN